MSQNIYSKIKFMNEKMTRMYLFFPGFHIEMFKRHSYITDTGRIKKSKKETVFNVTSTIFIRNNKQYYNLKTFLK